MDALQIVYNSQLNPGGWGGTILTVFGFFQPEVSLIFLLKEERS